MREKREPDWAAIERDYRAGILSVRAIAGREGISDTTIRKHAKASGWARDLADKVIDRARAMVRQDICREFSGQGLRDGSHAQRAREGENFELDACQSAADAIIGTLREHRQDIRQARENVRRLFDELGDLSDVSIRDLLAENTGPDADSDRAARAMQKALTLANRAGVVRDLSVALKTAIELERQALQIDKALPLPEPEKPAAGQPVVPVIDLQALIAKIRGRD